MKIQNKLFLILFTFGFFLITSLVLLVQWSIGNGMVDYVNTKEVNALSPLVTKFANEYEKTNSWQSFEERHEKLIWLIRAQLKASNFTVAETNSPKMRPPKYSPPSQQKEFEPSNDSERPYFRPEPPKGRGGRPEERPSKPPEFSGGGPRRGENDGGRPPPRSQDAMKGIMGQYALLDQDKSIVAGHYDETHKYTLTKIEVNGETVGYFAISKRNSLTNGYELDFIEQQQYYLWAIALVAMLIVILITLPLARHIVEPVKSIIQGIHKLTQGDYKQIIHSTRKDELGDLSRDYNELALTLSESEKARKRWLANISHELRTPVAILRGELEAMLDGVRPLTQENIHSAHDEVRHLERLIEDLHQLTSSDVGGMQYRKQSEDLIEILNEELVKYESYLSNASIQLTADLKISEKEFYCDKTRLCQLFENLMTNCIKYSSATLLKISVDVDETNEKCLEPMIVITIEDDGVGVGEQHLPYLFEYLYRVDNSRNRKTGGAGLGLSICRQIVEAHQGEIHAEKSSLGGLAIKVSFPQS